MGDVAKEKGRLLFVGRLIQQKNLFSLLDAVKDICGVHLVIIGRGRLRDDLIIKAKKENINVTFIDRVNNCDLPKEYNKSELFVLPSFFEGNPKVLLEAMACGLPVLGADTRGISNIVKDRVSGFLCKTDSDSIKGTISTALSSSDSHLKELGRNAREYVKMGYDLNKLTQEELQAIAAR